MNKSVLKIFRQAKLILQEQSQVKVLFGQVSKKLQKLNGSHKQINELVGACAIIFKDD